MESISAKRVWTSGGWVNQARVYIENGIIQRVVQNEAHICDVPVLIPGMIELHVHGSLGYSVLNPAQEETREWLARLAARGVTGVLPSPSTAPLEKMHDTVEFFGEMMNQKEHNGAKVLGVHLEGPFINPVKKGGMNAACICPPSVEAYEQIAGNSDHVIRLVSLAPEMEGAMELISYLRARNVRVNAGHSNATAEQMRQAIALGLDGVTHFFNAARPISHRDPGLLTAALLEPRVFCEAICDMVHLAPEIIQLLIQAAGIDRVAIITDAVPMTGLPDGQYGKSMIVNGSPRLLDGTLTGSRYLMDKCVQELIETGVDPWKVFYMASHTPARRIGREDLGDIAPLYAADLVAMDDTWKVLATMVDGKCVYRKKE